ncbi:6,7-dimethyl-8-ribityllumazine synthase [Nocardioides mangrovicus]|uniref:6,7-dimethyl-8-ribityllumazine synthase n=1 Tax=Nocardioides mangrovicus TaxID=2478913 RepID=A0A3L8P785_9ACTN|nr:6,7-dimethyl-8-ribityllumazine synthase [Nocardioides mangrovicus]RLV50238.1 6,7-dimethyl-8-ribityllumazine synthase [Nocardioides mangrovicus]
MSKEGAPVLGAGDCHDLRVAVVAASWHEEIMGGLLGGAERALGECRVEAPTVVHVPGSFELPVVAGALAHQGYDAIVALGVIIRGGTPHFEYVSSAATDGLARVATETGAAVGFGLLTCDDEQQARDRAGLPGSGEDKGYEAAQAALATARTLQRIRRREPL